MHHMADSDALPGGARNLINVADQTLANQDFHQERGASQVSRLLDVLHPASSMGKPSTNTSIDVRSCAVEAIGAATVCIHEMSINRAGRRSRHRVFEQIRLEQSSYSRKDLFEPAR